MFAVVESVQTALSIQTFSAAYERKCIAPSFPGTRNVSCSCDAT
jgi:hypothetical protein